MNFRPEGPSEEKKSAGALAWLLAGLTLLSLILIYVLIFRVFQISRTGVPDRPSGDTETAGNAGTVPETESRPSNETETDLPAGVTYPYAIVLRRDSYLPVSGRDTYGLSVGSVSSHNAIIVNLDDLSVTAELNADERIYPASMTKIMTLMVACDYISDLKTPITVSQESIDYAQSHDASMAGFLYAGETCTVEDLLYGVAVKSGAEATYMLVRYVAESEEQFVERMNAKCRELGLTATHFSNASGLHSTDNYTTVREMAAIFACALDNELCRKLLSTEVYTTKLVYVKDDGTPATYGLTMYNTLLVRMENLNKLYGKGVYQKELSNGMTVSGSKTGYIDYRDETGYHKNFTLATYATDGKKTYLVVTAGATETKMPLDDYQYLYKNFAK